MKSTGLSISRVLLQPEGDRVADCMQGAARFLTTTTPAQFLASVISQRSSLQRLLDIVSGFDHVGFLAPMQALADLRTAAERAGFGPGHRAFPSTILARELAQLASRDAVPTTIFRSSGVSVNGTPGAVEVFMPGAVEAEVVRRWIREGVGAHIAFRLERRSRFTELIEAMEEEGFRIPAFMNGGTLTNPLVKLTAVYFDRRPDPPVRLEFCHYE